MPRYKTKGGAQKHKRVDLTKYEGLTTLKHGMRDDTTIIRWFPRGNTKPLQIVKESIYSITHSRDAEFISQNIASEMKTKNLIITDATANVGGNTLSFAKHFTKVNAVEIDPDTCSALKNNVRAYGYKNVDTFCCAYTPTYKQDVVFMDPPWGGIDYRKHDKMMLFLGDEPIYEIANKIDAKLIVIKIPNNFDIAEFKKHVKNVSVRQFARYKVMHIKP